MSDEASAPVGGDVSYAIPADAPASMSVSEAARLLSKSRQQASEPPPVESAKEEATTEEPELAEQADAAPQEDPGEHETQEDEPDLPPIDPPRSWTKDEKELFSQWPREAQEAISRVASTREGDFRRSQNEAADAKKALEAKLAQAEELRKQYEARLPTLTKTIEAALQNEFGDIQSIADVRKMQAEDPFRFQAWQLRQMELAAAQKDQQEAEQRQQNEKHSNWATYIAQESKAFQDEVPEFGAKAKEYTDKAAKVLEALGFSEGELRKLANGDDKIALYDRRLQRLLFDRIRLDEIKAAPAKAAPKTLPPVQRPGVAKAGSSSVATQVQNLENRLANATGTQALKLAAELTRIRRSANR